MDTGIKINCFKLYARTTVLCSLLQCDPFTAALTLGQRAAKGRLPRTNVHAITWFHCMCMDTSKRMRVMNGRERKERGEKERDEREERGWERGERERGREERGREWREGERKGERVATPKTFICVVYKQQLVPPLISIMMAAPPEEREKKFQLLHAWRLFSPEGTGFERGDFKNIKIPTVKLKSLQSPHSLYV